MARSLEDWQGRVWHRLAKKNWRQAVDNLQLRHPDVSLGCLSGLFGKTRGGYYSVSKQKRHERDIQETTIVSVVKEIREQAPGTGAYKLFLMLKSTFADKMVGRDKFYKLMQKHQLMLPPLRRRHTTNSNHNYRKYKNLVKNFTPTAPDQLWVADITYVDTDEGVCYLHLITDAFTHEIIGWIASDNLLASNTCEALEQAIKKTEGKILTGLIHHSDRGSQYCCNAYVNRLKEIGISISMTEDYKPTDNAIAERVNGIIKQEWLYRMKRPKNIEELRSIMVDIIKFYNEKRLHYSNGMITPKAMRETHSLEASRLQP